MGFNENIVVDFLQMDNYCEIYTESGPDDFFANGHTVRVWVLYCIILAVSTRPPDGVLLAPAALA